MEHATPRAERTDGVRRVIAVLICVSTLATGGSTQEAPTPPGGAPAATASVPPSAAPGRAAVADRSARAPGIDLSTAISELVARMLETPRFEEHIEVRDRYQEALDAHLRAAELACGATESGPPSDGEMNRFRETRIPPHADLLAGAKWLNRKLRRLFSAKTPRYFLYSVRRVCAPERVVYVVRDGPISEDARSSVPGTVWGLVASFVDRGKAADALNRIQRGLAESSAARQDSPRTLWAATGCRR
jgi:hypothetical protein